MPEADEEAIAALYALPAERFVAGRKALVKQLRSAGNKTAAAEVARLRKPSATAWALDQVARTQPDIVEAVIAAGQRLREATEAAVGGDASRLGDAQREERRAIDRGVDAALACLQQTGRAAGDAPRRRVAATLHAAAVDDAVAERLRAGVLDEDVEATGLGLDAGTLELAAGLQPAKTSPAPAEAGARATRAERRRLETALERAEHRVARLRAAEQEAAERLEQVRNELAGAEREVASVRSRLDALE